MKTRTCAWCGEPLPEGSNSYRATDSDRCRQALRRYKIKLDKAVDKNTALPLSLVEAVDTPAKRTLVINALRKMKNKITELQDWLHKDGVMEAADSGILYGIENEIEF